MNAYILALAVVIIVTIITLCTPQSDSAESKVQLLEDNIHMQLIRCADVPDSCRGGDVGGW